MTAYPFNDVQTRYSCIVMKNGIVLVANVTNILTVIKLNQRVKKCDFM